MAEGIDLDEKIIEQLDALKNDEQDLANFAIILGTISSAPNLTKRVEIMMLIIENIEMFGDRSDDFIMDELDDLEPAIRNLMRQSSSETDPLIELTPP